MSFNPTMKTSQENNVSTTALTSTPRHLNSSPARLTTTIRIGIVAIRPSRGSASPKAVMAATVTNSGRHAMPPTGLPFSLSIVSALNSTISPNSSRIRLRISGK